MDYKQITTKKCLFCGIEGIMTNRQIICLKCKTKKCLFCNKEFIMKGPFHSRQKCCSNACANRLRSIEKVELKCLICAKKYSVYKSYLKSRISHFCSKKCQGIKKTTLTGENSSGWKGGLSDINRRIRSSKKWKDWRESVFKRDNYTCQGCNIRGCYLEPHHIKRFHSNKELRFEIWNGVSLCSKCHNKTKKFDRVNSGYLNEIKEKLYLVPNNFVY